MAKKVRQTKNVKRSKKNSSSSVAIVGAIAVAVIVVSLVYILNGKATSTAGGTSGAQTSMPTGPPPGPRTDMTDITAKVANGKITIPAKAVVNNRLVSFTYNGAKTVPLLAYVGPSKKITTAIAVCEPCPATRYAVVGDNLLCIKCNATWQLETHQSTSNGCPNYAPAILRTKTEGGNLVIQESDVANWKRGT